MKRLFLVFLVLTVFLVAAMYYFVFGSKTKLPLTLTISRGQSLHSISQYLYNNKATSHPRLFWIYMAATRQQSQVRAGNFQIPAGSNLNTIASLLTKGGQDDYQLTIKPGSRVEELTELDPQIFQFLLDKIGYLFPETYQVPRSYTANQVWNLIKVEFDAAYTQLKSANPSGSDQQKIIIIASLLEREAKSLREKQMVAGIINNRLELGMPLQIDATAQFARDTQNPPRDSKYWRPVSKENLSINSPYNTYIYTGLPPGPICNPGLDSIKAALSPISSNYLFYISDNSGQLHYATTLQEHNDNINTYLR